MPNTVKDNVDRVKAAKTAIGDAIVAAGGTVGVGDGLEDFATAIGTIPTGGDLGTKNITQNGTYNASSDNLDGYSSVEVAVPNTYAAGDEGKVVSNGALVSQTSSSTTTNGTVDTTLINSLDVEVENTYAAGDEGKVVSNGELVSQTSSSTSSNGTVDTTLINSLNVAVPNTYVAGDEGKVVSNGALVAQSSSSTNANGTVDTTLINSLSVNVPNTYTAGDEGKVVSSGALVAQSAYPTELKENDTYDTTNYNSVTVNVPVRGYTHGGVNFFDVDGEVLYSYTKAEFLALTEMPPNPDRSWDWLTAQGWNWTLADAKAYVTAHGTLNIGQHYITIDDKTAIHVVLDEGCLNPQLGLYINGTVVIEWGDGTSDTLTGNGTGTYKYTDHTYAAPGRYYILLTVTGTAVIKTKQKLLCKGGLGTADPGNESKKYINSIQDIHLGANIDIGSYAFYRCYSMKHISIPVGVSSIGNGTFQYCTSLKGVVIPNGITSLGTSTFEGCYGLNFASLPKTITSAGTKCFSQCYSLVALTCPESMSSIGTYGFGDTASCAILTIPGMTGELPQEFLARNRSLTDLVIPEGVTSLGLNAMDFCYGIKNVTLPSTLKSVAAYAFSNCGALTEITFPNTFETFGDHTFYKDTALQHFTFPTSVTAIPASMFEACHSLSHIVIPATITSIAAKAFAEGYGLSYIKFGGSNPPTLANANAFSGLPTDCKIYVPAGSLADYTSAQYYPDPNTYTYEEYSTT